jgi:uncharacterized protein YrzB (UPF0473 family)
MPKDKDKEPKKTADKKVTEAADVSLLANLLNEENDENIILFDEDGKEIELEQVAVVEHEGAVYAVLHDIKDPEEEVLVFLVDPKDEETIRIVEDEKLANQILRIVMKESSEGGK